MIKAKIWTCLLTCFLPLLLHAKITLHFHVDESYLTLHTLTEMPRDHSFSSDKNKETITNFQNEVWVKNEIGCRLLPNAEYVTPQLCRHPSLQGFINFAKSLKTFHPLYLQTETYKKNLEKLWEATYDQASRYISDLTGFKLDGTFEVYITHPSLKNGTNWGENQISWGCSGPFKYYDVVYLWHEVLHSFLPHDDVSHCLIQLLTDNGLRLEFNKDEKLFPLIGHPYLAQLMDALYPKWEKFLQQDHHNIVQLLHELKKTYPDARDSIKNI